MDKTKLAQRLKNKVFLAALAGFIYQILKNYGLAPDESLYKLGLDLLSYGFIGAGIYSTFDIAEEKIK